MHFFIATDDMKYWNLDASSLVFADHGCLRYSQKEYLKNISFDFLSPLFSDNQDLKEKYEYLESIKKEITVFVVDFLNQQHELAVDVSSWNLLIHYWLSFYVNEMYRCYINVKKAKQLYPNVKAYGIDLSNKIFVKDTSDFNITLFESSDYGMQFYTYAFEYLKIPYVKIQRNPGSNNKRSKREILFIALQKIKKILQIKKNIYGILKFIYNKIFFNKKNELLGIDVYLSNSIKEYLYNKTKGKIKFTSSVPIKKLERYGLRINYKLREKLSINYTGTDDFIAFVCRYILSDLPCFWVENFKKLNELSAKYYPKKINNLMTSTCWANNDIEKNFFRNQRFKNKSKIIELQHGGNYGLLPFNDTFNANYMDIFYTWGWETENSIFKRMPAGKLIDLKKYSYNNQRSILYSSTCSYKRRISFHFLQDGYSYTERIKIFLDSLSADIRQDVVFRKYAKEYNWEISAQLKDRYPSLEMQGWEVPLYKAIQNSRIFFVDNLNTTWIEAISIGIPTIICFDIDNYVLSEPAKKIFNELAQVGIFHSSPVNAAKFLENIYPKAYDWWNSYTIQSVIKNVKNLFGWVPSNSSEIWISELISLLDNKLN